MELRDRVIYHQIHPVKLVLDPGSGLVAVILMWKQHPRAGVLVALAPPAIASFTLIRCADLRPQRCSALGRYAADVPLWTLVPRLTGYCILLFGAWRRRVPALIAGFVLAGAGLLPWRWFARR